MPFIPPLRPIENQDANHDKSRIDVPAEQLASHGIPPFTEHKRQYQKFR